MFELTRKKLINDSVNEDKQKLIECLKGDNPVITDEVINLGLRVFQDTNGYTGLSAYNISEKVLERLVSGIYNRHHKSADMYINIMKQRLPNGCWNSEDIIVRETYDYSMFHKISGNRGSQSAKLNKILDDPRRVRKIIREMLQNGIKYIPILVNEKYEIIDGQSRFEAYKALGTPVLYIMQAGLDIDDVIRLNTTASNWSKLDYVECFAELGEEPYILLLDIKKQYDLNLNTIGYALFGQDITTDVVKAHRLYLDREILESRRYNLEFTRRMYTFVKDLKSTLDTGAFERLSYAFAVMTHLGVDIDEVRLKDKIKTFLTRGTYKNRKIDNVDDGLDILTEVYNYNLGRKQQQSNDYGGKVWFNHLYNEYREKRNAMTKREKGRI